MFLKDSLIFQKPIFTFWFYIQIYYILITADFGPIIFHIFSCCCTLWISFILSISKSILNALPITKITQLALLKHWFNFKLKVAIFEFCILSSNWVHSTTLGFKLNAGTMRKWFYLVEKPTYKIKSFSHKPYYQNVREWKLRVKT